MSINQERPALVGDVVITPAAPEDLDATLAMLEAAQLPVAGVREHFGGFLVARDGDGLIGAAGVELYGRAALLRSVVVAPEQRGSGVGAGLVRAALALARAQEAQRVFLLTETAADYFPRFGFRAVPREDAEPDVGESVEFQGACPDTALCLRLDLGTARPDAEFGRE